MLASSLLLATHGFGGGLIPGDSTYHDGDGLDLKRYTIAGLVPDEFYLWTQVSSATLELPTGRIYPTTCFFRSPGNWVRLTGLAGTAVEDELDRILLLQPGTVKPHRAVRRADPLFTTYPDGTALTFQRNTLAPADLAGEEWHPSLGTPCVCQRTDVNEWQLNGNLEQTDFLARETLVIAPPGATSMNVTVGVRLWEGDVHARGCVALTSFNGATELDSKVFTLDSISPRATVILKGCIDESWGYRVWIFASNSQRFTGAYRFVVEHQQVHASGSGLFRADHVRIGLTRPMWSVWTGVVEGQVLPQRLYDQDALSGLKLSTTAAHLALEYRSDVQPLSPEVASPALIAQDVGGGGRLTQSNLETRSRTSGWSSWAAARPRRCMWSEEGSSVGEASPAGHCFGRCGFRIAPGAISRQRPNSWYLVIVKPA